MHPLGLTLGVFIACATALLIRRLLREGRRQRHPRVPSVPIGVSVTMAVAAGVLLAVGVVLASVRW